MRIVATSTDVQLLFFLVLFFRLCLSLSFNALHGSFLIDHKKYANYFIFCSTWHEHYLFLFAATANVSSLVEECLGVVDSVPQKVDDDILLVPLYPHSLKIDANPIGFDVWYVGIVVNAAQNEVLI
mmetsp:Transcript_23966/g.26876  ORF Transcript_23966/g.26876 Transcript_23966/m.26876 type:complete len:126 (+) Transcript_23966:683-1060(+)